MEKSDAFMQISFKKEFLKENNLINIEYPVPLDLATKISAKDSHIDFADMLFWLQEYSSSLKNDSWEDLEPAMLRLSEVIAQKNNDPVGNIHTPDFYIHVQPHKLDKELISIMRRDKVLAVILPGDKLTISIMVFYPLDARSIRCLMDIAKHPHPEHGVSLRENNWEYALDCAAPTMGSMLAQEDGRSYFAYWEYGLGVNHKMKMDYDYTHYYTQRQTMPNVVAAQIGTYYTRMEDY